MYCHKHSIVHRDLRLENIHFEEKTYETIKITEFGASENYKPYRGDKKKPKHHKYMNEVVGALYYIAPEIFEKEYDEKVDLWSIGVIMYMMLTGEPPFTGASENEIIKNIKTGICNLEHPMLLRISFEG